MVFAYSRAARIPIHIVIYWCFESSLSFARSLSLSIYIRFGTVTVTRWRWWRLMWLDLLLRFFLLFSSSLLLLLLLLFSYLPGKMLSIIKMSFLCQTIWRKSKSSITWALWLFSLHAFVLHGISYKLKMEMLWQFFFSCARSLHHFFLSLSLSFRFVSFSFHHRHRRHSPITPIVP